MVRVLKTARKSSARKPTHLLPDSPYGIRMNYNENIRHYVHRLNLGIEHFHYNILGGQSNFLTPERRSQILLHTLIGKGPYAQLTKKYVDLYINGKPNDKYYYDEQWIPTVDYLEKAMMEAKLCMQNYHVYTRSRWRRIAQMAETPEQLAARILKREQEVKDRHKRKGNGESSSNPQGYDKRPRLGGNSNGNGGNGQQGGRNNNNQRNNHRGQGQQNQQGSRNRLCRKCDKSHPGCNCNGDFLTCFECGEWNLRGSLAREETFAMVFSLQKASFSEEMNRRPTMGPAAVYKLQREVLSNCSPSPHTTQQQPVRANKVAGSPQSQSKASSSTDDAAASLVGVSAAQTTFPFDEASKEALTEDLSIQGLSEVIGGEDEEWDALQPHIEAVPDHHAEDQVDAGCRAEQQQPPKHGAGRREEQQQQRTSQPGAAVLEDAGGSAATQQTRCENEGEADGFGKEVIKAPSTWPSEEGPGNNLIDDVFLVRS
uniref:Uncharacterized protein n=1 Tax=Chenopodium quinoa TaxID=63459 RepID=A0A803LRZ8_CHEQI